MAELIKMPKMSDTMTEGVIAEWHKKVGDSVKSGDVLAEVETDKATMDLESYQDGTLLYIGVEKGASVPVDGVLAVIGEKGDDYQSLLNGNGPRGNGPRGNGSAPTQSASVPTVIPAAETPTAQPQTPTPQTPTAAPAEAVNATVVRMPKMSDTMTEGTLVAWNKKVGDSVKSGDVLAEVETDKATMDLEAYEEGTLLYVGVEAGSVVKVDDVIAIIGEAGANYQALLNGNKPEPQSAEPSQTAASGNPTVEQNPQADVPAAADTDLSRGGAVGTPADSNGRLKASPLAKRMAEEKGINLAQVTGTGPEGRIVRSDIEAFKPGAAASEAAASGAAQPQTPTASAPQTPTAAVPATGDFEDIPVSQMRKTIARRLSESLFTAPHFYLTMEINMDKAMELRGTVNGVSPVKISFNDFVVKAASLALKQHPAVNSSWLGDKIRRYNYVNIGIAVAVEEGLLVPVVRNADQKTLSTIAGEVKDMAAKAKDKKLQPKDWEGSTFSISNLGMFGIDEFTAIINPPDACILAVGAIKQTVTFDGDVPKPTNVMKVTLSCDHRVVDGATGAAFLQTLKELLENPMRMLV